MDFWAARSLRGSPSGSINTLDHRLFTARHAPDAPVPYKHHGKRIGFP